MKSQIKFDVVPANRYSINESCEILGVSRSWLYSKLREGSIKFGVRKVNNRKFITGRDIIKAWEAYY